MLIRNDRPALADTFLVTAVLTVLALRVYLAAANYPQLGGNGLHVAHVLWGGLLMAVAIGILLSLLTPASQFVAAAIGGAGFGLFIDELGKFLTSDNNYFFKPTASLVYAIFILFFLAVREVRRFRKLTPRENLVNAVEAAKELALGSVSRETRTHAQAWLSNSDPSDSLAAALRTQFEQSVPAPDSRSWLRAVEASVRGRYHAIVHNKWFGRAVTCVFCVQAVAVVLSVAVTLATAAGAIVGSADGAQEWNSTFTGGPIFWLTLVGTFIVGMFTVVGVTQLPRSRHRAYRAFVTALLVDLLLVQPFTLLDTGFAGLVQVFIDLGLLAALGYMQSEEKHVPVAANTLASVG
jgi:hypothetical protein